jgi:retron-type reverse transcriptase
VKSLRGGFDEALTFEKFLLAYRRAHLSKSARPEVVMFDRRAMLNVYKIYENVRDGKYKPSKYRQFEITDPKPRTIYSLPFTDRIVHQWMVEEFIKPYYIPRFITDTYACVPKRGTHKAVDKTAEFMKHMHQKYREDYYIVKMDISKFFYSIDRDVLFGILVRRIADERLRELVRRVIYSYDLTEKGIPIGNYTSQYFANIYMNELDQFVKRELKVKCYVRYMDDFVCFVRTKAEAREVFEAMGKFLAERLKLTLNRKSRYYPAKFGLDFCGFRLRGGRKLLRLRSRRRGRIIAREFLRSGNAEAFARSLAGWIGHAGKGDCLAFRTKVFYEILSKNRADDLYSLVFR